METKGTSKSSTIKKRSSKITMEKKLSAVIKLLSTPLLAFKTWLQVLKEET